MSRMRPEEYVALDAVGLAALVHRGEVTPLELIEAAIERIETLNPRLNAVVERDYDRARAAAGAMDLAAPLAGVPFLAKDINIEVAGLHLTSSCRWLEGLAPAAADAPLAGRRAVDIGPHQYAGIRHGVRVRTYVARVDSESLGPGPHPRRVQ